MKTMTTAMMTMAIKIGTNAEEEDEEEEDEMKDEEDEEEEDEMVTEETPPKTKLKRPFSENDSLVDLT